MKPLKKVPILRVRHALIIFQLLLLSFASNAQSAGYLTIGAVSQTADVNGFSSCSISWTGLQYSSLSMVRIDIDVNNASGLCLDATAIANSVASPFVAGNVSISGATITIFKSSGLTSLPSNYTPLITVFFKSEPSDALTIQIGSIHSIIVGGGAQAITVNNNTPHTTASSKYISGLIRKAPQPYPGVPPECEDGSDLGIPEVDVDFNAQAACYPGNDPFQEYSYDGNYQGFITGYHSFVVSLSKDDDTAYGCGVNEDDLDKVRDYIFGSELPETLQQLLASDFNASGTVTTYDIANMGQAMIDEFIPPSGWTAWQFVSQAGYDNNNPPVDMTIPSLPPSITTSLITTSNLANQDFYGIKRGDVLEQDCTTCGDGFAPPNEDRSIQISEFHVEPMNLQIGQVYEMPLIFSSPHEGITVLSMELLFNHEEIEVLSIEKEGHLEDGQIVQKVNQSKSTAKFVWFTTSYNGENAQEGQPLFKVRFIARKNIPSTNNLIWQKGNSKLNNMICGGVKSKILLKPLDVKNVDSFIFKLSGPNPSVSNTQITGFAPDESPLRITMFDSNGKIIQELYKPLLKGWNEFNIGTEKLPSGTYGLRLMGEFGIETLRFVKQ